MQAKISSDCELSRFACDAMLGGLARWLRGAGYDAVWRADWDDWEVIRFSQREGRILLTSDTGIFRIGIVRDSELPALWIPHGLRKSEQLAFVLEKLNLVIREPRCMACGGKLVEVPKHQIRDRVPARSFHWLDHFFQCDRCGKIFWQGTHWQRIAAKLKSSGIGSQKSEIRCQNETEGEPGASAAGDRVSDL